MKTIKKLLALSAALSLSVFLCSCSENSQTGDKLPENSSDASGSVASTQKAELTEDEKSAAAEAGISEERYCTDNSEITKIGENLLKQYYDGMSEADHDKCFGAFPDFYKAALEKENQEYGETNEQYIQSIRDKYIQSFGDDYYVYPTVDNIFQISDSSLNELQEAIRKSFGNECVLEDLYCVYFTETARGSLDKSSYSLNFDILKIDGEYYLYDDYYEVYDGSQPETTSEAS